MNKVSAVIEKVEVPEVIIKPERSPFSLNFKEMWAYRELLYFLIWRDIKVRYKQTVLGITWAVLQPLLTMIVFTIFFGRLAKVPSDGIPYPVFNFCALLPWTMFSRGLSESSTSLVANTNLVSKVYFPRLIIPIAPIMASLVDFSIAFVIFAGLMVFYGIVPTAATLMLPLFILFAMVSALAVSLWLSALNVEYRDVRHTIPFLTQFWMFASPIAYSSSLIPEQWRFLYGLNPMAGVIEGFRWALLGKVQPDMGLLLISAGIVLILLLSGLVYFTRMENTFADVI